MKKFLFVLGLFFACLIANAQNDSYKIGNTEYYIGKTYSTTGKPMVKRSESNKKEFLERLGYQSTPYGYEVDHIKPLSEGGTDDPSNMQLLTIEQHAIKTARERGERSNSTYSSYPSYNSNSTYSTYPKYNSNNSIAAPSGTDYGKTIYTGKNGGQYYINSNGNKTYIKSNSSTTNSRSNNYTSPTSTFTNPSYNTEQTIQTGARGGQYYINSNGNKTYVKKKN